jgi:hypothetical protein
MSRLRWSDRRLTSSTSRPARPPNHVSRGIRPEIQRWFVAISCVMVFTSTRPGLPLFDGQVLYMRTESLVFQLNVE